MLDSLVVMQVADRVSASSTTPMSSASPLSSEESCSTWSIRTAPASRWRSSRRAVGATAL